MEKTLIENPNHRLLEIFDRVSEEAKKEKQAIPPINKMLYWWTRKPLIVGRAVVLASTLTDIEDMEELLGLSDENKRAYVVAPNPDAYGKKLDADMKKIKVLDPFAGAGNLIFGPARLGLDCYCSDYNPMAYLLQRSVLEYPSLHGNLLVTDLEKYAKKIISMTKNDIGKFFGNDDLVYLWAWCIQCPHCNQRFPLMNHMYIAKTSKKKYGFVLKIVKKDFTVEIKENISEKEGKKFTQKGGKAICISCTNAVNYSSITQDISKRKDRELLCIQKKNLKKRYYVLPTKNDLALLKNCHSFMQSKISEYEANDLVPTEDIRASHRKEHTTWHYGIVKWREFFSERQLMVMSTFLKNIKLVCNEISDKNWAAIMSVYLGFMLCKHVNTNSLGAIWSSTRETPVHALTMRRPSMVYNHVEINPFQKVSASFPNILKNITDGIKFAGLIQTPVTINMESVMKKSEQKKYDLIITDPPYLDDVQYAELSDFMYVWLYRSVKYFFKTLPNIAPTEDDICESWGRFGDKKLAADFFERGIVAAFASINHILKEDGLFVIFFAHSSTKAWKILLDAIRSSHFRVVASYAIHTESTSNVIAKGKTSFMSSIVVVCRKITGNKILYYEDLVPKVEDTIKDMIKKIPDERMLRLPITDLLIMVYGKVLEVITSQTELKSYRKDFKPDFESILNHSREFIMKEIVTKITGRRVEYIGPEMSFYLLIKIFHNGMLSYDDAIKITKTYGLEMEKIHNFGIIQKDGKGTKLTMLHKTGVSDNFEQEEIDKKNLYQQLSFIVERSYKHGIREIRSILSKGDTFRVGEIKKITDLIIKSYNYRRNRKINLGHDEKEELEILENLADILNIKHESRDGTLEEYQ